MRLTDENGGYSSVNLDGLIVEIDALYLTDNRGAQIPGACVRVDGSHDNFILTNFHFGDTSQIPIQMIADGGTRTNFTIADGYFGRATGALIVLDNLTGGLLRNLRANAANASLPVSFTSCSDIHMDEVGQLFAQLVGASGVTGLKVNGLGQQVAGAGNPPSVDDYWPVGTMVRNTDDDTIWLRVSSSATPATAWKQIA